MAQAAQPQPEWWRAQREGAYADVGVVAQPRDQARWGPIWAGVVVTLATIIILSVLGAAIGLTVFETGEQADTAALIWGAVTAFVAFFLGGLTAGRTAAVGGPMSGTFNGIMVWAVTLVLAMLLLALGGGAALGILGAFGLGEADQPQGFLAAFDEMGLWWAFIAMGVGLIIAAIGGLIGAPGRNELASREGATTREMR